MNTIGWILGGIGFVAGFPLCLPSAALANALTPHHGPKRGLGVAILSAEIQAALGWLTIIAISLYFWLS